LETHETALVYILLGFQGANNRVARYDVPVINSLARFFGIKDIGELLEYVEEAPRKK
jgi:hypothetical protein